MNVQALLEQAFPDLKPEALPPRAAFMAACEQLYNELATELPAECQFCGVIGKLHAARWTAAILSPPGKKPRPSGTYVVCATCCPPRSR